MIRVHNLRQAGFVNDPTAISAEAVAHHGDVAALIGTVTVSFSDRRRHPALSFEEEALKRFEQDEHTADDVLKAVLAAVEER